MHATTVAIDLAKDVFELAFADAAGHITERKRLTRRAFSHSLENRPALTVVMEACGSAHYWARRFTAQGHAVQLLPARDVRPYVRRNKTDRADAAGLLEAARCGQIDAVPVKTTRQQGTQGLHRMREQLKAHRVAAINLVRGLLREFGIVIPMGAAKVAPAVRAALEDGESELPMVLRATIATQMERIDALAANMQAIERRLEDEAKADVVVQRYQTVPGVGLLTATALSASAGELARFRSGRHLAAWLGLVPREHSSGNQRRLGRITKRGDSYVRTLLIHGGRSALRSALIRRRAGRDLDPLQAWALDVQQRQGHNRAAVAVANKLARRLWAIDHHGTRFDAQHVSVSPLAA